MIEFICDVLAIECCVSFIILYNYLLISVLVDHKSTQWQEATIYTNKYAEKLSAYRSDLSPWANMQFKDKPWSHTSWDLEFHMCSTDIKTALTSCS